MQTKRHDDSTAEPTGGYRKPELVVHGEVSEITKGAAQGLPDVGSPGSTFPDGNAP